MFFLILPRLPTHGDVVNRWFSNMQALSETARNHEYYGRRKIYIMARMIIRYCITINIKQK